MKKLLIALVTVNMALISACKSLSDEEKLFIGSGALENASSMSTDSDTYWICTNEEGRYTKVDNGDGTYDMTYSNCETIDNDSIIFSTNCDTAKRFTLNGTVRYSDDGTTETYSGSVKVTGDIEGTCEIETTRTYDGGYVYTGTLCGNDAQQLFSTVTTSEEFTAFCAALGQ